MVARNSLWVSVLGGLGCVALGAALGVSWAARTPPPVWQPASAAPAAPTAPPSFADVVERVAAGVVTVRALRGESPVATGAQDRTSDDEEAADGTLLAMHGVRAGIRRGSGFVCSPL